MAGLRATPAVNGALGIVKEKGLPQPAKPKGAGEEYDFPDDVNKLSSTELGNLRLKLSRFHGYTLRLLAEIQSQLSPAEEVFDLKRDVSVGRMSREWGKKLPAVDILRAMVIDEDRDLCRMQQIIIELRAKKRRLEAQAAIYERHLGDLSREQARRADEARHFA